MSKLLLLLIFCHLGEPQDGSDTTTILTQRDMAHEIAGGYQLVSSFHDAMKAATGNLDLGVSKDRSFVVPSIGNVAPICGQFLQRADHTLQKLFGLVKLFYSKVGAGGWDSLKKEIADEGQSIDNFQEFLTEVIPFLQFIRNARNCAEHPTVSQKIVVTDFSLNLKNMLLPPEIEIVHPRTSHTGVAVVDFFERSLQRIVTVVEMMMVFLCSRGVKSYSGLELQIIEIPAERRKYKHLRYGYGAVWGDQIVPFG